MQNVRKALFINSQEHGSDYLSLAEQVMRFMLAESIRADNDELNALDALIKHFLHERPKATHLERMIFGRDTAVWVNQLHIGRLTQAIYEA